MTEKTPQVLHLADGSYHFVRVLKADMFSINTLYSHQGKPYVMKRFRVRVFGGMLLFPLAMLVARREHRVYRQLQELPGVPRLGPRVGRAAFLHEYIPGITLRATPKKGAIHDEFFPRLREIIDALHRRRIFYWDLAKSDNIIVGEDGKPYLIDFQVCVRFPPADSFLGRLLNPLFERCRQEDLYHFCKLKRKWRGDQLTGDELARARRTKFGAFWWRWMSRPYLRIKRKVYPHGSDETIWWKWRRMQDPERRDKAP
ncbi:MAG TPA: hypothetical protein VIG69_00210 [Candidatus Methylomirabilis sp.]